MSGRPILLDTHAALWLTEPGALAREAEAELEAAYGEGVGVLVSPISAWEVGLLAARGRIALPMAPAAWFDRLVDSGVRWAPLEPQVLIASSFLPGGLHGDPADRVLVATARAYGYRLMTRDRALLRYGDAGHVQTLPC